MSDSEPETEYECHSCGESEFERTEETARAWPTGNERRAWDCNRCGVTSWIPEGEEP